MLSVPSVHSRDSARVYVAEAVESQGAASRDDFDIDAITAAAYALADTWDFSSIDRETFWLITSRFLKQ